MNAKEKQTEFIKAHLKPYLKTKGYKTLNQTWWKDRGDFYNVISLQNFSWNSKEKVQFCLNLGVALKATVKDKTLKKISHFDAITHLRENAFLPESGNRKFGNNVGYIIESDTDFSDFIISFMIDLDSHILPSFEKPKNLNELLLFYNKYEFWGNQLETIILENNLI